MAIIEEIPLEQSDQQIGEQQHDQQLHQKCEKSQLSDEQDQAEPSAPPQENSNDAEPLSDDEEQDERNLQKALEYKQQGNELFIQQNYDQAIEKYSDAIQACPLDAPEASIFYANRGACYLKVEKLWEAREDCTAAIELDNSYVKAYMRRCSVHEQLDDVEKALEDAKKVQELDGSNEWANSTVNRLQPIVTEKHEKLKEEMIGKLKDLGNSVLGNFGLSLDNFKVQKDENSGGYSINFAQ